MKFVISAKIGSDPLQFPFAKFLFSTCKSYSDRLLLLLFLPCSAPPCAALCRSPPARLHLHRVPHPKQHPRQLATQFLRRGPPDRSHHQHDRLRVRDDPHRQRTWRPQRAVEDRSEGSVCCNHDGVLRGRGASGVWEAAAAPRNARLGRRQQQRQRRRCRAAGWCRPQQQWCRSCSTAGGCSGGCAACSCRRQPPRQAHQVGSVCRSGRGIVIGSGRWSWGRCWPFSGHAGTQATPDGLCKCCPAACDCHGATCGRQSACWDSCCGRRSCGGCRGD